MHQAVITEAPLIDAPGCEYRFSIEYGEISVTLGRMDHVHAAANQLQEVLVSRKDIALPPLLAALLGKGGHQVIRLEAVPAQAGDAQSGENLLNYKHLVIHEEGQCFLSFSSLSCLFSS